MAQFQIFGQNPSELNKILGEINSSLKSLDKNIANFSRSFSSNISSLASEMKTAFTEMEKLTEQLKKTTKAKITPTLSKQSLNDLKAFSKNLDETVEVVSQSILKLVTIRQSTIDEIRDSANKMREVLKGSVGDLLKEMGEVRRSLHVKDTLSDTSTFTVLNDVVLAISTIKDSLSKLVNETEIHNLVNKFSTLLDYLVAQKDVLKLKIESFYLFLEDLSDTSKNPSVNTNVFSETLVPTLLRYITSVRSVVTALESDVFKKSSERLNFSALSGVVDQIELLFKKFSTFSTLTPDVQKSLLSVAQMINSISRILRIVITFQNQLIEQTKNIPIKKGTKKVSINTVVETFVSSIEKLFVGDTSANVGGLASSLKSFIVEINDEFSKIDKSITLFINSISKLLDSLGNLSTIPINKVTQLVQTIPLEIKTLLVDLLNGLKESEINEQDVDIFKSVARSLSSVINSIISFYDTFESLNLDQVTSLQQTFTDILLDPVTGILPAYSRFFKSISATLMEVPDTTISRITGFLETMRRTITVLMKSVTQLGNSSVDADPDIIPKIQNLASVLNVLPELLQSVLQPFLALQNISISENFGKDVGHLTRLITSINTFIDFTVKLFSLLKVKEDITAQAPLADTLNESATIAGKIGNTLSTFFSKITPLKNLLSRDSNSNNNINFENIFKGLRRFFDALNKFFPAKYVMGIKDSLSIIPLLPKPEDVLNIFVLVDKLLNPEKGFKTINKSKLDLFITSIRENLAVVAALLREFSIFDTKSIHLFSQTASVIKELPAILEMVASISNMLPTKLNTVIENATTSQNTVDNLTGEGGVLDSIKTLVTKTVLFGKDILNLAFSGDELSAKIKFFLAPIKQISGALKGLPVIDVAYLNSLLNVIKVLPKTVKQILLFSNHLSQIVGMSDVKGVGYLRRWYKRVSLINTFMASFKHILTGLSGNISKMLIEFSKHDIAQALSRIGSGIQAIIKSLPSILELGAKLPSWGKNFFKKMELNKQLKRVTLVIVNLLKGLSDLKRVTSNGFNVDSFGKYITSLPQLLTAIIKFVDKLPAMAFKANTGESKKFLKQLQELLKGIDSVLRQSGNLRNIDKLMSLSDNLKQLNLTSTQNKNFVFTLNSFSGNFLSKFKKNSQEVSTIASNTGKSIATSLSQGSDKGRVSVLNNTSLIQTYFNKLKNSVREMYEYFLTIDGMSFGKLGGSLTGITGQIESFQRSLSSISLKALFNDNVTKIAADYEDILTQITIFASEMDTARVEELATKIGIAYPLSSVEALASILDLAKAGQSLKSIENILPNAASLAALSDSKSLEKATQYIISATRSFANFSTTVVSSFDNATAAVDMLFSTANISTATIESLQEGLRDSSATANSFGSSLEEVLILLAALNDAGKKGSVAGTDLRALYTGIFAEKGKNELNKLNIAYVDAKGNFRSIIDIIEELKIAYSSAGYTQEQQAVSMREFGDVSAQTALKILMNVDSLRSMQTAIQETIVTSGGVLAASEKSFASYKGVSEQLRGSLDTLQQTLMMPILTDILMPLKKIALDAVGYLLELSPLTLKTASNMIVLIASFSSLAVILAGVLIIVSKFISLLSSTAIVITNFMTLIQMAGTVVISLSSFISSMVLFVIPVIGAISSLVYLFTRFTEELKEGGKLFEVWSSLLTTVSVLGNNLSTYIRMVGDTLSNVTSSMKINEKSVDIYGEFIRIWTLIIQKINLAAAALNLFLIMPNVKSTFQTALEGFKEVLLTIKLLLYDVVSSFNTTSSKFTLSDETLTGFAKVADSLMKILGVSDELKRDSVVLYMLYGDFASAYNIMFKTITINIAKFLSKQRQLVDSFITFIVAKLNPLTKLGFLLNLLGIEELSNFIYKLNGLIGDIITSTLYVVIALAEGKTLREAIIKSFGSIPLFLQRILNGFNSFKAAVKTFWNTFKSLFTNDNSVKKPLFSITKLFETLTQKIQILLLIATKGFEEFGESFYKFAINFQKFIRQVNKFLDPFRPFLSKIMEGSKNVLSTVITSLKSDSEMLIREFKLQLQDRYINIGKLLENTETIQLLRKGGGIVEVLKSAKEDFYRSIYFSMVNIFGKEHAEEMYEKFREAVEMGIPFVKDIILKNYTKLLLRLQTYLLPYITKESLTAFGNNLLTYIKSTMSRLFEIISNEFELAAAQAWSESDNPLTVFFLTLKNLAEKFLPQIAAILINSMLFSGGIRKFILSSITSPFKFILIAIKSGIGMLVSGLGSLAMKLPLANTIINLFTFAFANPLLFSAIAVAMASTFLILKAMFDTKQKDFQREQATLARKNSIHEYINKSTQSNDKRPDIEKMADGKDVYEGLRVKGQDTPIKTDASSRTIIQEHILNIVPQLDRKAFQVYSADLRGVTQETVNLFGVKELTFAVSAVGTELRRTKKMTEKEFISLLSYSEEIKNSMNNLIVETSKQRFIELNDFEKRMFRTGKQLSRFQFDIITQVFKAIQTQLPNILRMALGNELGTIVNLILSPIIMFLRLVGEAVQSFIMMLVKFYGWISTFLGNISLISRTLHKGLQETLESVSANITYILNGLRLIFGSTTGLEVLLSKIVETIRKITHGILRTIVLLVSNIISKFLQSVNDIFSPIRDIFVVLYINLIRTLVRIRNDFMKTIVAPILSAITSIKDGFKNLMDTGVIPLVALFGGLIKVMMHFAGKGVSGGGGNLLVRLGSIAAILTMVISLFNGLQKFFETGNLIDGIAATLRTAMEIVIDTYNNTLGTILGVVNKDQLLEWFDQLVFIIKYVFKQVGDWISKELTRFMAGMSIFISKMRVEVARITNQSATEDQAKVSLNEALTKENLKSPVDYFVEVSYLLTQSADEAGEDMLLYLYNEDMMKQYARFGFTTFEQFYAHPMKDAILEIGSRAGKLGEMLKKLSFTSLESVTYLLSQEDIVKEITKTPELLDLILSKLAETDDSVLQLTDASRAAMAGVLNAYVEQGLLEPGKQLDNVLNKLGLEIADNVIMLKNAAIQLENLSFNATKLTESIAQVEIEKFNSELEKGAINADNMARSLLTLKDTIKEQTATLEKNRASRLYEQLTGGDINEAEYLKLSRSAIDDFYKAKLENIEANESRLLKAYLNSQISEESYIEQLKEAEKDRLIAEEEKVKAYQELALRIDLAAGRITEAEFAAGVVEIDKKVQEAKEKGVETLQSLIEDTAESKAAITLPVSVEFTEEEIEKLEELQEKIDEITDRAIKERKEFTDKTQEIMEDRNLKLLREQEDFDRSLAESREAYLKEELKNQEEHHAKMTEIAVRGGQELIDAVAERDSAAAQNAIKRKQEEAKKEDERFLKQKADAEAKFQEDMKRKEAERKLELERDLEDFKISEARRKKAHDEKMQEFIAERNELLFQRAEIEAIAQKRHDDLVRRLKNEEMIAKNSEKVLAEIRAKGLEYFSNMTKSKFEEITSTVSGLLYGINPALAALTQGASQLISGMAFQAPPTLNRNPLPTNPYENVSNILRGFSRQHALQNIRGGPVGNPYQNVSNILGGLSRQQTLTQNTLQFSRNVTTTGNRSSINSPDRVRLNGISGYRAKGGPVAPGELYEVGEHGKPELFRQNGRTYLIPGNIGNVVASKPRIGYNHNSMQVTVDMSGMVIQGGNHNPEEIARMVEQRVVKGINDVLVKVKR